MPFKKLIKIPSRWITALTALLVLGLLWPNLRPHLWWRCLPIKLSVGKGSLIKSAQVYRRGDRYLICVDTGQDTDGYQFAYVITRDDDALRFTYTAPLGRHLENLLLTTPLVALSPEKEPRSYSVRAKMENDKAQVVSTSPIIKFTDTEGSTIRIDLR